MKLKIKKYTNNNKQSNAYGKTYGRIQHQQTLGTLDVAKHIQKHGSIFTQDVIVGVLQRFSLCIEELLQEGYKVKLDGLGTFYLAITSKGEEKSENYSTDDILRVRIRFLADKSKAYDWSSTTQTTRATFSIIGLGTASGGTTGGGGDDDTSGGDTGQGETPVENRP